MCRNRAALKVNLENLRSGGLLILDSGAFVERNLRKAGYDDDPRADGSLAGYRVVEIDVSQQTLAAVAPFDIGKKAGLRSKNMWLLGLVYWMYDRDRAPIVERLNRRFAGQEDIAAANIAALNAGHAFGETLEIQDGGVHGNRPCGPFDLRRSCSLRPTSSKRASVAKAGKVTPSSLRSAHH